MAVQVANDSQQTALVCSLFTYNFGVSERQRTRGYVYTCVLARACVCIYLCVCVYVVVDMVSCAGSFCCCYCCCSIV